MNFRWIPRRDDASTWNRSAHLRRKNERPNPAWRKEKISGARTLVLSTPLRNADALFFLFVRSVRWRFTRVRAYLLFRRCRSTTFLMDVYTCCPTRSVRMGWTRDESEWLGVCVTRERWESVRERERERESRCRVANVWGWEQARVENTSETLCAYICTYICI